MIPSRSYASSSSRINLPVKLDNTASFGPLHSSERRATSEGQVPDSSILWADSPSDLAEQEAVITPERSEQAHLEEAEDVVQNLYHIIKSSATAPETRRGALVEKAITLYNSLGKVERNDAKLNQALLEFIAPHTPEGVYERKALRLLCRRIFNLIPLGHRSLQTYQAIVTSWTTSVRRAPLPISFAKRVHQEALDNLENGHQISRMLVRHALERGDWMATIEILLQLHEHFAHDYEVSQIRVFWLHVSETPRLLEKSIAFAAWLGQPRTRRLRDSRFRIEDSGLDLDEKVGRICTALYKEAITQEFLLVEGRSSLENMSPFHRLPTRKIRLLMDQILESKDNRAKLLGDVLMSILQCKTGVNYAQLHQLASPIYEQYREMPRVTPSEELFMLWLERLTEAKDGPTAPRITKGSMNVEKLVSEWERYYGHVSMEGVRQLIVFYARQGDVKTHDLWFEYFRSTFPDYKDQKDILWTTVYVHAQRADLGRAQQAFAEVRRITSERDDEPDLKSWNVLLNAHSRTDDLDGALTNLQNLLDSASLTPDAYTVHPVLQLLAERGDVNGVVDLLQQFGQLFNTKLTTALLNSVLVAHVNNDDITTAEDKLRQSIPLVRRGMIQGSLTGCFNVIMLGHALRRDLESTLRTYRWMKDAQIPLDGKSYAAIMQALVMRWRTGEAYHIMKRYMLAGDVLPTSFHYAIIIAGFVQHGNHVKALQIHQEMLQKGYQPTLSTNIAYLKAKSIEERGTLDEASRGEAVPLEETISTLKRFLRSDPGIAAHPTQPLYGLGFPVFDTETAVPAAYITFLIELLGQRRCFEAVRELHRRYVKEVDKRGGSQDTIPISMLAALARAHYRAEEHEQVDICWKLAKAEADRVARLVPVPKLRSPRSNKIGSFETTTGDAAISMDSLGSSVEEQGGSEDEETTSDQISDLLRSAQSSEAAERNALKPPLAPARRHILTRILRFYLLSKKARSEPIEAINTVTELTEQGYTLDQLTWNSFIRTLVQRSPPLTLLAFVLTERYLTPNFPGWTEAATAWPSKRKDVEASVQKMKKRYLAPGQLMPRYDTLVALAGALLATRRSEALGYNDVTGGVPPELREYVGDVSKIETLAPETLAIVKNMPRVHDRYQTRALEASGNM